MNKKKIIIGTIVIAVLALLCGAYMAYENYQLGQKMYRTAIAMSIESKDLADSIDYLEKEFQKADNEDAHVNASSFANAISTVRSSFGFEDVPILEDVRGEYAAQFEGLWKRTLGDEALKQAFTDEKSSTEISALKNQLNILVDSLNDFTARYNQMSDWERLFTSWSKEREKLSDQVRIPTNEP